MQVEVAELRGKARHLVDFRVLSFALLTCVLAVTTRGSERVAFVLDPYFLQLPSGMHTVGDSHGDIAVSPSGEIYVSVEGGERPGIQVYSARGRYLRNIPDAPNDIHGFIIAMTSDGVPNLFGARLSGQQVVQMTLDGRTVRTIEAASIPDQFKTKEDGKLLVYLTGVAVAPNGDIYVVDGYGRDFIHRFDSSGRYLSTFGGQEEPWGFKQCHQIAIDPRFDPVRLLCTDRLHGRLVHMDLQGNVIGVFASGLRWPSDLAIYHDELAVAELEGRVTILDRRGKVIAFIGTNDNTHETKTNEVPPEAWKTSLFYAPHGIAYDARGDLLVTEWSKWGRVVRVSRR